MPGGRPSKYTEEFAIQATKLCELGATDKDLADFFKVNLRTIGRWAAEHVEFCRALKVGKAEADDRVERSLFHKANGYSFQALKIMQDKGTVIKVPYTEHVPPDTTACIFWLKNRRPELWRDVTVKDHTGKIEVEHSDAREHVARNLARLAARSAEAENPERPDGQAMH